MGRLVSPLSGISAGDLPVGRTEIELSAPWAAADAGRAVQPGKELALIRLHGHPLGVVLVDTTDTESRRAAIWEAMRGPIVNHLAADGLPRVDDIRDIHGDTRHQPRCLQSRADVLTDPPAITVVIATRERPELLRDCLNSLQRIEYPRYEVLVVDNAPSTERTERLITEEFSETARYLREDRRGLAWAHNRALAEVTTHIVAFIDDDVEVDERWLTGIAEGFRAAPDVGCVTGLILPAEVVTVAQLLLQRHGDFDKGFIQQIYDMRHNRPADPLFPFTAGRLGSGANMAFSTAALRRLGGFDPALGVGTSSCGGDDLAAFFNVVLRHRLVYQPNSIVWHRHHRDTAAMRNQAFGYGVGLGAYLTSVLLRHPKMAVAFARRLPASIIHARNTFSQNNTRYDGWPRSLVRREKIGIICGPARYIMSHLRNGRVPQRMDKRVAT